MTSKFVPTVLLMLLPLLSSFTSAPGSSIDQGCDTKEAADCMTYSEQFRNLSEEEQHTECGNARKTVSCLEEMVSSCPSMQTEDKELYDMITEQVAIFKADTVHTCSAATFVVSLLRAVMSAALTMVLLSALSAKP